MKAIGAGRIDNKFVIVFHMEHCTAAQIVDVVQQIDEEDTLLLAAGHNDKVSIKDRELLWKHHIRFRPMSKKQLDLDPKRLADFMIGNLNKRIQDSRKNHEHLG